MEILHISIGEAFSSPAWGSNFVVFATEKRAPIPETEVKKYLDRATAYAKQHQVYLVPERFVMLNYHSLCLIDPTGQIVGAQQALHLSEQHQNLSQGTTLDVIHTEFGSVFLCVDADIYYPQVAKIATNMGANYIIASQYIEPDEYSNHHVVGGIWGVAQSNYVFAAGVSNMFAGIAAPRIIKQYNEGFVVAPTDKKPVTAAMNAGVLAQLPTRPTLSRRLYALHERELLRD